MCWGGGKEGEGGRRRRRRKRNQQRALGQDSSDNNSSDNKLLGTIIAKKGEGLKRFMKSMQAKEFPARQRINSSIVAIYPE